MRRRALGLSTAASLLMGCWLTGGASADAATNTPAATVTQPPAGPGVRPPTGPAVAPASESPASDQAPAPILGGPIPNLSTTPHTLDKEDHKDPRPRGTVPTDLAARHARMMVGTYDVSRRVDRSFTWLIPAFGVAFGVCLPTALLWPIAALSRRRHGLKLGVTGLAWHGHLALRVAAVALSLVTVGWFTVVALGSEDLELLAAPLNPLLILLCLLSVIVYVGGAVVMLWSARIAWTTARPIIACIWTGILALSAALLLYFAMLYHSMSFATKY